MKFPVLEKIIVQLISKEEPTENCIPISCRLRLSNWDMSHMKIQAHFSSSFTSAVALTLADLMSAQEKKNHKYNFWNPLTNTSFFFIFFPFFLFCFVLFFHLQLSNWIFEKAIFRFYFYFLNLTHYFACFHCQNPLLQTRIRTLPGLHLMNSFN